jgi:phosphoribosyl 1,2-cyclic phosphodiesterase
VGKLQIRAFRKRHDAVDPISFSVCFEGVQVGIFTDIGRCCDNLITHFRECQGIFLESNYCEELLAGGAYPYHLKKRISGGYGHISNREALEIFLEHRSPALSHLLLSHLSGNNNTPERALETFRPHAGNTQVVVASRHAPSPLFTITQNGCVAPSPAAIRLPAKAAAQLSMF